VIFCAIFLSLFLLGKGPQGAYLTYVRAARNITNHVSPYSFENYSSGFKYSPLFGVLFTPFPLLSIKAGGGLWQFLNFLVFMMGLLAYIIQAFSQKVPLHAILDRPYKLVILLVLTSNELLGALMNAQINPLICGMMLLGLVLYARRHYLSAGLTLALASNFKLFPLCLALLLLWDFRLRYWLGFWAAFLISFFLPALMIGWDWNLELLRTWHAVLTSDFAIAHDSRSLLRFLRLYFDFQQDGWYYAFVAANIAFLCLGYRFFFSTCRENGVKILFPLIALFILLFNHRSENALFVFACPVFVALYLILLEKRMADESALAELILLPVSYFLISVAYSDLVPERVSELFNVLHMKTLGALLLYLYFLQASIPWRITRAQKALGKTS